jgi:Carbohydrate family 9 binding domain-like/F5/8 type C domain
MFKNIFASFLFAFVLSSNTLWANRTINVVKTSYPPTIDGKLNDPCWKKAKPVTAFKINETEKPAKFQTIGYILYDDDNLYIGVKCFEPNINNLKANVKKAKHDGSVHRDDCIEIMLDPTSSKNDYFHFMVNALGAKYDRFCREGGLHGNKNWDGEWKAKSFIGKDYWSCEMIFPFYMFEITSAVTSTWGINLCREKKNPPENSSIAKKGSFNVAGRFANIKGLDVNFRRFCYKVGKPIISTEVKDSILNAEVSFVIDNQTGKTQEVKLACWLVDPDKNPNIKSNTAKITAGKEKAYKIGTFTLRKQGEYDCYTLLKDPEKGDILHLSKIKIPIEYVPIAINIIEPFYRDAIFATQNLKKVILEVENKLDKAKLKECSLKVEVRKDGAPKVILSKRISNPLALNKLAFNVEKLPYGNLEIFAAIKDKTGKTIAETRHKLQKLPYKKGEVWLGRDRNWYIDGKPFFPNMAWARPEDNNPYYNVCWGYRKGKKGVIAIYHSSHYYAIKKSGKLDQRLIDYTIEKVKKNRDNPNLFAYQTTDEPSLAVTAMETMYKIIRKEDPYHPILISHNRVASVRDYLNAADYHDFHCYPIISKNKRVNDLSKISKFAKAYLKITDGKKFVGFMDQAFNYGDWGRLNERIHTYQESRGKMLLALICGAKGALFYNRTYLHYPELYIGAPHLAQELNYLGEAIIAPDAKLKVKVNSNEVKTLLKDVNGELYLFVSNAAMKPRDIQITIPGIKKYSNVLNVISENRKITLKGDSFTDRFDTFEVHIYTTSKKNTGLLSVKEISRKISKINKRRKKPGNLAFQEFEGDGVTVSASSNARADIRQDNGLWHVVDGIVDKIDHYKALAWHDKTPNKFPDWLEIKLPRKHDIGRVVVYPFAKSLKDYSIQAFVSGKWKVVDKASGKNEEIIIHTFKPVNTDRIRILVTATNGPDSEITEVEIYEK